MADSRLAQLSLWVAESLSAPSAAINLVSVSGDASFRRYFRLTYREKCYIAVDAPPDKEENPGFVALAQLIRAHGLKAPKIYRHDFQYGFLLLEDFGDRLLLAQLNTQSVETYYKSAMNCLLDLQRMDCSAAKLRHDYDIPRYCQRLLRQEQQLFIDWFLLKHLHLTLTEAESSIIEQVFLLLEESALAQPQVFVHRDYHARNIMLLDSNELGLIDFQDGVIGPISYDLVSLLKDCYIHWPRDRVTEWVAWYLRQLEHKGLVDSDTQFHQFLQWFDWMGLQRHLKVAGIFSRLSIRDAKAQYLNDIPRVMGYVRQVSGHYKALADFDRFLRAKVLPAYYKKDPRAEALVNSVAAVDL